jgi:glycosyltransferase involved in cell wall biosynthesis
MKHNFRLSIIIATYNAEKYLTTCIDSILKDKTESVELIIIDGGSSDSTVNLIKSYKHQIDFFLSEPDKGIYDAWNKAIGVAKGEWIAFIGSDDIIYPDSLPNMLEILETVSEKTEFIFSKAQIISNTGKTIGYRGKEYLFNEFKKGMTISHVFSLHRKRVFKKMGLFDLDYKICADYEFMMRYQNTLVSFFLPIISVKMMIGGMSFTKQAIKEAYKIRRKYQYNSLFLDIFYLLITYIGFYRFKIKMVFSND